MEIGTVREWHDEEGWGVVDSPATPGGCWAHFSAIQQHGYRDVDVGERVTFSFKPPGQDGYSFSAEQIWPTNVEPGVRLRPDSLAGGAYQSILTITLDDGTVLVGIDAQQFLRRGEERPEAEG